MYLCVWGLWRRIWTVMNEKVQAYEWSAEELQCCVKFPSWTMYIFIALLSVYVWNYVHLATTRSLILPSGSVPFDSWQGGMNLLTDFAYYCQLFLVEWGDSSLKYVTAASDPGPNILTTQSQLSHNLCRLYYVSTGITPSVAARHVCIYHIGLCTLYT